MRSLLQVSIWRNNDIECTPSKGYKKMKIKIIALGKIKEKFLKDGIDAVSYTHLTLPTT